MRKRKGKKKWELTGGEGTVKSTSLSVRRKIRPGKFFFKKREREIERERGGEGLVGYLFQRYKQTL